MRRDRKLQRAIAKLDNTPAVATPAQVAVSARQPIAVSTCPPPARPVGERRHVTVMFCDLVDSTGIAARLDAEEWRDLVGAYLDAASAAVAHGRSPGSVDTFVQSINASGQITGY
jgi:class 3 adenylate cyclase